MLSNVVENVVKLNDRLFDAIEAGRNTVDFFPCFAASSLRPTRNIQETSTSILRRTRTSSSWMTPRPTLCVHLGKILFKSLKSPTHEQEAGKPARGIPARLLQSQKEKKQLTENRQYWALGSFYPSCWLGYPER
jgi:hypothetical protein